MSAKTQRTTSSKSSRRVVFAPDALSTSDGHDSRMESALSLCEGEEDELQLMDLPPPPTTAGSEGLESAITIYTPGEHLVHVANLGGLRRDSCQWTNTNVPCINKVAAHLAALQRQIEAPSVQTFDGTGGRMDSLIGPTPGSPPLKVTSLTSNPSLEVIDEVKTLIGRLESDRNQTIKAYQREVERVKLLQIQVDKVEQKRLYILPKAVQLEHEACAQDIAELKWDLVYWQDERKTLEGKVESAKLRNLELQETITRLTEQCPNIKDKLDVDKKSLEEITGEMKESKMALDYTQGIYNRTVQKLEKADGRAEAERVQLRKELADIRGTLQSVQNELKEAEDVHAVHTADINELNKHIDDAKEEGEILDTQIAAAKRNQDDAQNRVNNAKINLLEVAENIKARRRANKRLSEQMATKKTELDNRDKKQQRTLRYDKSMLREALQTTVKMEREIIDFKKELTVSIKKARDDEKATSRAQAELKHLDQQLQVVVEEVQKLAELNARLTLEAHRTDEDIINTETALRNNLTMLRKTLQDEIQAKTSLNNKMESETDDFDKYQMDSSRKLARTEKKKNDLETIHTKYSTKKNELDNQLAVIHTDRDELNAAIHNTKTTFDAEKTKLDNEIATLKPECAQVKEDVEETQKSIDDLQWRSDLVSKKIQETVDATKVVLKIQKQTDDSIDDILKKIDDLEEELAQGQETEKNLQTNLNHIQDNQLLLRNQHRARLDKRLGLFRELKESVEELIKENIVSAEKYNQLQATHLKAKTDYQTILDTKLDLETSVKEIVKVAALQKRMHKALISYYMHRGYHNRIVLNDFGKGATVNLLQLEKIHRNLMDVIGKTDHYLGKHGSGVVRKQPRVPSPDLFKALTDLSRLPILIETPPPVRDNRRHNTATDTEAGDTRPNTNFTDR